MYVDDTGGLTWLLQAWAAVLALWPAALCHQSALRAADGPGRAGTEGLVHVAVSRDRSPAAPRGVRLHRLAQLDDKVQWNLSPPRVRVEHAVLDVAAEAVDDLAAIAVLTDAVQARRTSAGRLLDALERRQRIGRRAFLEGVLRDVDAGTCSALEQGYLARVERPHGLPTARRQVRESARGPVRRDVAYEDFGLLLELDGRPFHDSARGATRTSIGPSTSRSADGRLPDWGGGGLRSRLRDGAEGRPAAPAARVDRCPRPVPAL